MNFAPIALFCYRRLDVLKKTVEALKNNPESKESLLFVFSDGYKNDEDKIGVEKVREYIKTLDGFKNIEIIEAPKNKGLANSIIDGVTKIVNEYGKIIVVEDDILTSKYFLKYMNDALDMYENEENVGCISAYVYPIKTNQQTFFIKGSDCWGWATWKNAWEVFEANGQKLLDEIRNENLEKDFNFDNNYPYVKMLEDQIQGKNNSWAIRWLASCYLKNKLCLYPNKTFVQNIGFGVEGATHCAGETDAFDSKLVNKPWNLEKIEAVENKKNRKMFVKYFKSIAPKKRKNIFFKREKDGNKRIVTILGCIKIKYKKNKSTQRYGFFGDYQDWNEVEKLCDGYDSNKILEKTLDSILKVKNKEAVFERDSYIFDKIQYSYPLLSSLLKVASENNNELDIVDFGGALGSHYFQNKEVLKPIKIKNWTVIEQSHYTDVGNEKVSDGILNFKNSLDEIKNPNTLIVSSCIQYLKNPYEWLDKFINKGFEYIIFDRTAFSLENKNRLTLQKVPPEIYEASYPAWFLDEKEFLSKFDGKYNIILDFENNIDVVREIPSIYKGYLFKKK